MTACVRRVQRQFRAAKSEKSNLHRAAEAAEEQCCTTRTVFNPLRATLSLLAQLFHCLLPKKKKKHCENTTRTLRKEKKKSRRAD